VTDPTVVEQKFLDQQYTALRTEIENAHERAFKIFAASVLVVPTGLSLGAAVGSNVLPLIKMLLPLVLLAFYAMYWAQIHSTHRTGLYIQSRIEPSLLDQAQGWESWLSDRRYAYDAQVDFAFFLLSAVYYIGTVYLAVTADVKDSPALTHLTNFFNIANQTETVLLPDQWAEKLSYGLTLFIFYALAAFVVLFLVYLTPKRELEEERKMEQIIDCWIPGKRQEDIQELFKDHLPKPMKVTRPKSFEGRIKHSVCYKDNVIGALPAWHMRLTMRKASFKEAMRDNFLHLIAASITCVVLLLWVWLMLERFYYRLAHKPGFAIEWLLPPGLVHALLAVSLVSLLVLLIWYYHRNIGRRLGTKVTIKVLPTTDRPPDGPMTRYIVRTSLKEDDHDVAKLWVKNGLEASEKGSKTEQQEASPDRPG
jgi:hypothetical protein